MKTKNQADRVGVVSLAAKAQGSTDGPATVRCSLFIYYTHYWLPVPLVASMVVVLLTKGPWWFIGAPSFVSLYFVAIVAFLGAAYFQS